MPTARTPAIHDPQRKLGSAEPRLEADHASLDPANLGDSLEPLLDLLVEHIPPTETRGMGRCTNHRSSTADELVRLVPPRKLSLDPALAFLREDECIEVTPDVGGRHKGSRSARSAA